MKIKTLKTQPKYALNKESHFLIKKCSNKCLSALRISQRSVVVPSNLSFDSFFYRDHVTFKKYSYEHLKGSSNSKRQLTQGSTQQDWRLTQQNQIENLIQYIELWKSIKSNRNNILVHNNNKKNAKDQIQTLTQLTNKKQSQISEIITQKIASPKKRVIIIESPKSDQVINNKTAQKVVLRSGINSERKYYKQKNCELYQKSENIGMLKKKMNDKLYRMNKQLLRDYLMDKKHYNACYNYLIKDQDNLQSKINKIKTLINVLQSKNQNIDQKSSNIQAKNLFPFDKQNHQGTQKTNHQAVRTSYLQNCAINIGIQNVIGLQLLQNRINYNISKKQIILKMISDKYIQNDVKNNPKSLSTRKKRIFCLNKPKVDQKIDKIFEKQSLRIDEQIMLKYRRQAEYSLNDYKKQKYPLKF